MENLRVAIVGCGRMGRERASAATQLGARVVAVCDTNIQMATACAAHFPHCRMVRDIRDLDWAALDAVFVCVPPYARGPVEVTAIHEGVPLFMEKPIGLSVVQCIPVQQALATRPVINAVGYMNRYRDSVQRARQVMVGKTVLGVSGNWVGGPYHVPWWRQQELSGGPVNEQATHLVDLVRYLVGEITAVHALTPAPTGPQALCEAAVFALHFAHGALGSLFYSCMASCKMINVQVFLSDMNIRLEGWDFQWLEEGSHLPLPLPEPTRGNIFHAEVAAFLEAVSKDSSDPILCDFTDAVQTQYVVDALKRSILSGHIEQVVEVTALP